MNFPKKTIDSWISFLLLGGTPLIMLLVFYFIGYDNSTLFVILTKILLFLSVMYYTLKNYKYIKKSNIILLFMSFWIIWFIRVFHDSYYNMGSKLMLNTSDYYLFSFFFAMVPFFYGIFYKNIISLKNILSGIIIGNVLFSLTVLVLFHSSLSNMHRLGTEDGSVNPLMVSYIASMNIAYFIWKIIIDKYSWIYAVLIVLNIPVVGFGASKGAIIALVFALFIVLVVVKKTNFKIFLAIIASYVVIQNASVFYLGTIADRFSSSIETNESSEKEIRYYLWEYSLKKFMDNPIFGYYTEIKKGEVFIIDSSAYPHNIILESFLSMGIIGGILMLSIIFISIKNGIKISKRNINESWILLFFLIAFYQNLFSGNIYSGAIWFWFFVGLINGRDAYLARYKTRNRMQSVGRLVIQRPYKIKPNVFPKGKSLIVFRHVNI